MGITAGVDNDIDHTAGTHRAGRRPGVGRVAVRLYRPAIGLHE